MRFPNRKPVGYQARRMRSPPAPRHVNSPCNLESLETDSGTVTIPSHEGRPDLELDNGLPYVWGRNNKKRACQDARDQQWQPAQRPTRYASPAKYAFKSAAASKKIGMQHKYTAPVTQYARNAKMQPPRDSWDSSYCNARWNSALSASSPGYYASCYGYLYTDPGRSAPPLHARRSAPTYPKCHRNSTRARHPGISNGSQGRNQKPAEPPGLSKNITPAYAVNARFYPEDDSLTCGKIDSQEDEDRRFREKLRMAKTAADLQRLLRENPSVSWFETQMAERKLLKLKQDLSPEELDTVENGTEGETETEEVASSDQLLDTAPKLAIWDEIYDTCKGKTHDMNACLEEISAEGIVASTHGSSVDVSHCSVARSFSAYALRSDLDCLSSDEDKECQVLNPGAKEFIPTGSLATASAVGFSVGAVKPAAGLSLRELSAGEKYYIDLRMRGQQVLERMRHRMQVPTETSGPETSIEVPPTCTDTSIERNLHRIPTPGHAAARKNSKNSSATPASVASMDYALTLCGLSKFRDILIDRGYDRIDFLERALNQELEAMGMKDVEARRLRRFLKSMDTTLNPQAAEFIPGAGHPSPQVMGQLPGAAPPPAPAPDSPPASTPASLKPKIRARSPSSHASTTSDGLDAFDGVQPGTDLATDQDEDSAAGLVVDASGKSRRFSECQDPSIHDESSEVIQDRSIHLEVPQESFDFSKHELDFQRIETEDQVQESEFVFDPVTFSGEPLSSDDDDIEWGNLEFGMRTDDISTQSRLKVFADFAKTESELQNKVSHQ